MSGHSKWHNIKGKKSAADAERGKVFTKLTREITTAVRQGGANPDSNVRLRVALDKARENNVPSDTVKRAIQKGTGELAGQVIEEITYEGYGVGGVAVMVEVSTDNRNRAGAAIRHTFSRCGGNLGEAGCVNWMFQAKGVIELAKDAGKEDDLMMVALDAGADDFAPSGDIIEVITPPNALIKVSDALKAAGGEVISSDLTMLPSTYVTLAADEARRMINLTDALEDQDDVVRVYTNFDISDEELQRITAD
jgi:YebC/PmpR family DNA-binding regulatory protein